MKLYDISLPISENLTCWESDPKPVISRKLQMRKGDICNLSAIEMGLHTGTHIDAPYHFIPDGSSIEKTILARLIGPCSVYELDVEKTITREDLVKLDLNDCGRVLFKTSNSSLWKNPNHKFHKDFISLGLSGAQHLVEQNCILVGIDYLSVEEFYTTEHSVHTTLLENDIIILEGINLSDVPAGKYELLCLPLLICGVDGSPARVVLRDISS